MNTATFAEEHKDFVLKLHISLQEGDSQIRRVRLPRILDSEGKVSYSELEGIAISFTFPENPKNAADFLVNLTYKDLDEDSVLIGSSDELVDAIDQFSDKRLLRITAEVKRRIQKAAEEAERISSRGSADVSTQANSRPQGANPQILNAVDTFATIVTTAAHAVHEQIKNSSSAKRAEKAAQSEPEKPEPKKPEPKKPEPEKPEPKEAPKESAPVVAAAPVEAKAPEEAPKEAPVAKEAPVTETKPAKVETEAKPEKRAFIHGRHTCDGCLRTPIIGKRYHAKNMPDYDLCEACRWNYKGTEIEFEVVELDRDRPYQQRWNRRHDRLNRGKQNGRRCARRRDSKTKEVELPSAEKVEPPQPPHHPPHHPPPPFHGHAPHLFPPPPHGSRFHHPQPFTGDPELEEALRRSLSETLSIKEESATMEPSAPTEKEILDAVALHQIYSGIHKHAAAEKVEEKPVEKIEEKPAEKVEEKPVEKIEKKSAVQIEEKSVEKIEEKSVEKIEEKPAEKIEEKPAEKIEEKPAEKIEEKPVEKIEEKPVEKIEEKPVEKIEEKPAEKIEEKPAEKIEEKPVPVEETSSSVSESGQELAEELQYDVDQPKSERSFSSNTDQPKSDKSFSSDAEGNGDVAAALGETLDMVSEAIDGVLSEIHRHSSFEHTDSPDEDKLADDVTEAEPSVVGGATILDSVAPSDGGMPTNASLEDGWQVVSDNQSVDTEGVNTEGDAALAFAAQMIGSALFNSDMSRSGEMLSTVSGDGQSISSATSVPTTVGSLNDTRIVSSQRHRWSSQLSQLHELGFCDDEQNIGILERLTAANIGVESMEEVTVTDVVNELYKGS